jgi:hypothetical protein
LAASIFLFGLLVFACFALLCHTVFIKLKFG